EYSAFFEEFFAKDHTRLNEVLVEPLRFLLKSLGIRTRILLSSEIGVKGTKDERLLAICRELGADSYLSGPSGKDYLDLAPWKAAGIGVHFHDYRHPVYPQVQGDFLPEMSVIDLLFNCGRDSLRVLTESQPDYGAKAAGGA
ncbi:MAG TPA: WbqC family protein, partial [Methanomicrobiales archaeon]|nr:WbqC family protein [Methanomicrobiales archaeon]